MLDTVGTALFIIGAVGISFYFYTRIRKGPRNDSKPDVDTPPPVEKKKKTK